MFESILRSYKREKSLQERRLKLNKKVHKTREMPVEESAASVGPDAYSLMAARVKLNLSAKGPQSQSTVDMRRMKGDRDSFLYHKLRSDYQHNAHHVI